MRAKIEFYLGKIYAVLAILMFAFLFYNAMRYSWLNKDLSNEHVYVTTDSFLGNLIGLALVALLVFAIGRLLDGKLAWVDVDRLAIAVSLICMGISIYWIYASCAVPQSDQAILCEKAAQFNNNDFHGLEKGGYIARYRQQLGLVTFLRILYKIFGEQNFRAYQIFSALMIFVLVYSGYRITREVTQKNRKAGVYYLVLALTCAPMYCYVPFVYGEIASTALVLFAVWMMLSACREFRWYKAAAFALALGIAVQLRQNVLIVVVATAIVLVVKCVFSFDKHLLVMLAAVLVGVMIFQIAINVFYASKIPEDSESMPSILWVAMGTSDDADFAGWHNGLNENLFFDMDCDPAASSEAAKEYIAEFIETCSKDPDYAADFFWRKLSAQWSAPMYQGFAMNNRIEGEQDRIAHSAYFGRLGKLLAAEMNIYQIVVYGGILFLLFATWKQWRGIENYVLLIAVFGGFLFSAIWEAKPRYVFPYLLMMLPYAAAGVWQLQNTARSCAGKIRLGQR